MLVLQPQFFDIFGAIGFIYIIIFSLLALFGKTPPKWMLFILFFIGIIGFIVDSLIVYSAFAL